MNRWASAFVVVLAVLGTAAGSAWATFPGRNGKIAYGWNAGSAYRGGPVATSIRTVDPRSGRVRVLRDCAHLLGGTGGDLRRLVNAPTRDALDPRGGFVTGVDWQPLPRVR